MHLLVTRGRFQDIEKDRLEKRYNKNCHYVVISTVVLVLYIFRWLEDHGIRKKREDKSAPHTMGLLYRGIDTLMPVRAT